MITTITILLFVALSGSYDPLSLQSLYLNVVTDGQYVFSGTGFLVEHDSRIYLVTNQHVFTGIEFFNNTPLAPDSSKPVELHLWFHGPLPGEWIVGVESLYNEDVSPRWITHRYENADAAVLPLENIPHGALIHTLSLSQAETDLTVMPGITLYIIGFPYGRASTGKMPIWKTAHLASEYDLDVEGARAFLVDATTREGMSGAPVVLRSFECSSGENVSTRFMGIYSAQYLDAEIGIVWRPEIITEILQSIR
ncbi:MAG: trypsin-like peptidase domain-containing protein [Candidatus Sabulitectum sp.]|nr:trypsin-like peptidase domain-containing protein [Candidatus Sabulitectum sp.]